MKKLTPLGVLLALALALFLASSAQAAGFGISSLAGGVFDSGATPQTQAGSSPYLADVDISFNTVPNPGAGAPELPAEDTREVLTSLPPGLIGNPTAAPTCPSAVFFVNSQDCPPESVIGYTDVVAGDSATHLNQPLYNLTPDAGTAAKFGFIPILPVTLVASLSPHPPYNALVRAVDITQAASFYSAKIDVWGIPADPAHDAQRGGSSSAPLASFVTQATSCEGPPRTDAIATSWPGSTDSSFFESPPVTGCDQLSFEPTLQARPTTNVADSPSGLDVDLHVPQHDGCLPGPPAVSCENAVAHLRDTTVILPDGLLVNPSSANGLGACSPAQIDLDGEAPATCPDASKLATVQVDTPLLDHPVNGAAYLATPHQNPFGSLLALYIVLDDPATGTRVKLAGEVHADPSTGQLSTTFKDSPQVPFEDFHLHFKAGPHGTLRTPPVCGDYTTTSQLTPWSAPASGPPATPSDAWSIQFGPGGGCAQNAADLPNAPALDAGTAAPLAKTYTPFLVHLRREDGSQSFSALEVSPPPGLVAKLAGTPPCPESALAVAAAKAGAAEQASPSCPAASRVGSVYAAAGSGPDPFWAPGSLYLTGPYEGAPISFAAITPAVAGPFDLGTIVVRVPAFVDPATARVTTRTDPIPQILDGIPLDVRALDVALDRPEFTLTGTSCDPAAVSGSLTSSLGQAVPLSSRFQLAECSRLAFKPKISLSLKGGTKRASHPSLTVVLQPRAGDADIASLQLTLPHSEFLDQAHIQTVCTRVQYAADACPKGAVYGHATVTTPILDYPLTGNVYLRSSDNILPDLVPDLRGPASQPIRIESAGRTDSIDGGIRNTFDFIPDAPFTKLVTKLPGARKGLLQNSTDICRKTFRAKVKYTAHNGLTYVDHPALRVRCKHGHKERRGRHR
jgi:hypothetical protein